LTGKTREQLVAKERSSLPYGFSKQIEDLVQEYFPDIANAKLIKKTLTEYWDPTHFNNVEVALLTARKRILAEERDYRRAILADTTGSIKDFYEQTREKHSTKMERLTQGSFFSVLISLVEKGSKLRKLLRRDGLCNQNAIKVNLYDRSDAYRTLTKHRTQPGRYDSKKTFTREAFKLFEPCFRKHTESFPLFNTFAFNLARSIGGLKAPLSVTPLAAEGQQLLDRNKCIKKGTRSLYKFLFKYNEDGKKLKDLLRCTFVFKNRADMQRGLNQIIATRHDQINIIKNGWANYTQDKHGEYVDVTIIFVLDNGACCEVQLLTKPLYDFKTCLHKDYGMTRIVNSPGGTEFTDAIKRWTESADRRRQTDIAKRAKKKNTKFAKAFDIFSRGTASQQVPYGGRKHTTAKRLSKDRWSKVRKMSKGESAPSA